MKISAINNYNTRIYGNTPKQKSEPVNFTSGINTYLLLNNPRFKNIISKGYHIFDSSTKIIDSNGKAADAIIFVNDSLRSAEKVINMLLTDENCYALGIVSASPRRLVYDSHLKALGTAIRNYTISNEKDKLRFEAPFVDAKFADTSGTCKHVGKNLYDNLVKYLKKYHPDKDILAANVNTSESWNFHRACGFTMDRNGQYPPPLDGFDSYSPCGQDLYLKLK